jgi:hypothetical protein
MKYFVLLLRSETSNQLLKIDNLNTANAKKEKETTLQNLGNRSNVQAPQSTGFNRNQSTDNDQSGFGLGFGNTAGNRTRFGHGRSIFEFKQFDSDQVLNT